jgi:cysteine synthase
MLSFYQVSVYSLSGFIIGFQLTNNINPALNMLQEAKAAGKLDSETHIVEYSSGSTVTSLAILGRIMGLKGSTAYVSNKTNQSKLDLLRFFGLEA